MQTKLQTLLPPAVLEDPEVAAAELPRALMARTNFIPGVRHRLGWRGMRDCSATQNGLTVRVTGKSGVFGLEAESASMSDNVGRAAFRLYYFPDPTEEVIESYSVQAGIIAHGRDYLDRVRDFTQHDDLRALFGIARLESTYVPDTSGICLTLTAVNCDEIRSLDGLVVQTPEGPVQAIEPGGVDQNLPCWETAWPLFQALAASASYCLGVSPDRLEQYTGLGTCRVYGAGLPLRWEQSDTAHILNLSLGYSFEEPLPVPDGDGQAELVWKAPSPIPEAFANAPWWDPNIPGAKNSFDKRTMGITDKPRLIVLTGFLGAGKTSFLARFIENQASKGGFVAVIQNEIGQKGLDGKLLGQHFAVTEVDEGCVCCTLAGSLRLALADILSEFQPDFVVLETTGLANPSNLLQEIADLDDMLDFASVTTILDAVNAPNALANHEVARSQVRLADVLLLNKIDQANEADQNALCALVRELNPSAPMHHTMHGDISPAMLYGVNFRQRASRPAPQLFPMGKAPSHQQDDISSAVISFDAPLDRAQFSHQAESLPSHILRVKGVVDFIDASAPEVFQYVPGSYSLTPADADTGERFLVVIGQDAKNAAKGLFAALQS
ncbi:CobW family GTP-binding protein [Desulfovibrio ferrophilus]|uniref:Cobalamin synthesis protein P47K n=1 Tax=Desulfovibrio ferrophilus TaxID=241368 RepID=A0A2Z6AWV0_9BACT|nr:GTP-binding protein [Desulfovibrio ferrophilus]BBD07732.1 cobalamin synthesis protein P47K [Desulfovibrio ferrophilus]